MSVAGALMRIPALVRVLGAGALGAGFGYGVAPYMAGYEDDPGSRRLSGAISAATWATLAGLGPQIAAQWREMPLSGKIGLPAGYLASELIPVGTRAINKATEAAAAQAEAAKTVSIPAGVSRAFTSPTAKGIGVGAGAGALAGLLRGMNRLPTTEEVAHNTSRVRMAAKDVLKYMLPAMVAGGVAGSLSGKQ